MAKKDFTILYVDDEPNNLLVFRSTFRRDYKVLTANSAQEGIEILNEKPVHLIITDQRMPGMTGVQFLEQILPEFPDPIRMILTGFSDVEAIIKAINDGQVFRYITKPWDEQELRVTLKNAREMFLLRQNNKQLFRDLQTRLEEQEKILQTFQKFVPEPVVKKVLESSDESIFDGEVRHVTVLFCDIRGFTSMSEELPPRKVVSMLNRYYSVLTDVVEAHDGSVNQFVGDEIFAVFGAPLALPQCEEKAVFCAVEMMRKMKELNEEFKRDFDRTLNVGIGLNSGEVVAGNMGSHAKIAYSITGDTVNTGKRIETLTRDRPNAILISDGIHKQLGDSIDSRPLEPVSVRGKKEKLQVWEVMQ